METRHGSLGEDLKQIIYQGVDRGSWSYRSLARRAGVPRTSISKFMRGETGLSLSVAAALYETLEVGPKLLEGAKEVQRQMRSAIENTQTGIYAIVGYEATFPLLKCIEDAASRGISYKCLFQGELTRKLEKHIEKVSNLENAEIRYAPESASQYQNMLIADSTIFAMLGNDSAKDQSAMRIQGRSNADHFVPYFDRVFSAGYHS